MHRAADPPTRMRRFAGIFTGTLAGTLAGTLGRTLARTHAGKRPRFPACVRAGIRIRAVQPV